MKFDDLFVGQTASVTRSFGFEEVEQFARLSGDLNPIHTDANYASTTPFKKPIVHGFLYGSLISSILANQLPGPGSIYLHQELNFKAPVFHGDEVIAIVKIAELKPEKKIVKLDTFCHSTSGMELVTGMAVVKLLDNE